MLSIAFAFVLVASVSAMSVTEEMVRLLIKRGDEEQFLYDTSTSEVVDDTIGNVCAIYNGMLKILRLIPGKYHLS